MDFLDPKKKRSRKIRLAIGHALMVVLVAFGTFILVLQAYGFDYDRQSGEVIQNGLLYLDSAPDNATITINGQVHQDPTNTRLSLPGGVYTVEISKQGYRSWQRTFELDGGTVVRFSYPALFLNDLKPEELLTPEQPFGFASQSPDRRWIVLQEKNLLSQLSVYDLGERKNKKPVVTPVSLPVNLMTPAEGDHRLELVEWSTDNKNLLVQHSFSGGQEYLIININKPAESLNVTRTIGENPSKITLFDKKVEKLYLYDADKRTLRLIDVSSKLITPIASNVISYKTHGDDKVFMSAASASDKTKAEIILRENGKNNLLRLVPLDAKIPLDFASSGGDWYAIIGVQSERRLYVYKNPLEFIKTSPDYSKTFLLTLKNNGPIDQVSFSDNTRFIMSQSGQYISTYDTETDKRYGYRVKQQFDKGTELKWMDGHRFITRSGGQILIFDFNGINVQKLIAADADMPIIFDRDYTELYSISTSAKDPVKKGFFLTNLRLAADK